MAFLLNFAVIMITFQYQRDLPTENVMNVKHVKTIIIGLNARKINIIWKMYTFDSM